jgi:hypothetical protein
MKSYPHQHIMTVRRQSISGTRGVELMETWFTFLPHFSPELQEVISTLL